MVSKLHNGPNDQAELQCTVHLGVDGGPVSTQNSIDMGSYAFFWFVYQFYSRVPAPITNQPKELAHINIVPISSQQPHPMDHIIQVTRLRGLAGSPYKDVHFWR